MATSTEAVQSFPGDYETVFAAVVQAIEASGMKVVSADQATGAIQASKGMTLASWGENLGFQVGVDPTGAVQVAIHSGSKMSVAVTDWGRNKRIVGSLFHRISEALQNPAAPSAGAWHPDPAGRHEHRWWDGTAWTDQVSDGGTVSSDPI